MVAMSRMFSISSDDSDIVARLRSLAVVRDVSSRGVSSMGFTKLLGVYIGIGIDGGRARFADDEDVGVASRSGDMGDARSSTAWV